MADDQKPKPKKQLGKRKADLARRGRIIAGEILNGSSTTEAIKSAGYSESYAKACHKDILNHPEIKQTFTDILNAAGLTDEHIAERIRELSGAKETRFFQKDGIVTDEREVEALGVQADMIQFAARLKGHLTDKSQVVGDITVRVVSYADPEKA